MVTPSRATVVPADHAQKPVDGTASGAGLQAVLWDMDGTIVDTEPYWIQAESELVAAHGGTWIQAQAEGLVGQALTFSARVLQNAGVQLSVRDIIDTLTEQVTAKVRQSVPWRPGARELLQDLRERGIPRALVTMSEQMVAGEGERQLPEGTFTLMVTGDMVEHGKPNPEAYLLAFEKMSEVSRIEKDRVVAIEDSIPGVTAARAAGLVTLGVPHFVPLPPDSANHEWGTLAGRSVEDLAELIPSAGGQP